MSVTVPVIDFIDGAARRIHLRSGVTTWDPVDDIYVEVKQLRQDNEALRQFDMFVDALPLIEKSPGNFTSRGLIMLSGTRIAPFDESADHKVTGELLSDEGISGTALIDKSGLSTTSRYAVEYAPPAGTEVVSVGSGLDPVEREVLYEIYRNLHWDRERVPGGVESIYYDKDGNVYKKYDDNGSRITPQFDPIV